MKISLVMGYFLPVPALAGGATEKIWGRFAQLFAAAGHDVTVISRQWPGLPPRETHGTLTHVRLPGANHTRSLALNLLLDLRWSARVFRALPPADVVICNTVSLPVYLRRLRPSAGRVAVVLGRMPKGQCRAYGAVDCVLATSTGVAQRAVRENASLANRIHVFPNPIDWTGLGGASRAREANEPLVIGYVGRLHPEKGLELLLRAAELLAQRATLPAWKLELIGPDSVAQGGGGGAYTARLLALASDSNRSRIHIRGPEFDPAKLAARYAAMDVFCYPSVAEAGETFGIAIAEAMAAGCAPVVSGLACFQDLIEPERTGLVFDHTAANAPEKLAAQLARLLESAALRRAIADSAQEHVRTYDYPAAARTVLDCLQRCVSA